MTLGQSLLGEKFVWVGGFEGKFSDSFGPKPEELGVEFGLGPSWTINYLVNKIIDYFNIGYQLKFTF